MWRRTGGTHYLLNPGNFEYWLQKQRSQLLDDLFWVRHELKLSWYMTLVPETGPGDLSRVLMNPTLVLQMAIKFMGQAFCQLTLYSVPLALHSLLEILSFQMNSCLVQLSAYCSMGKIMTISVQFQTTFMYLHRVSFVWTGGPCTESSQWVFKRYVYVFCMVSAPTKTYNSSSIVKFWIWASVSC